MARRRGCDGRKVEPAKLDHLNKRYDLNNKKP